MGVANLAFRLGCRTDGSRGRGCRLLRGNLRRRGRRGRSPDVELVKTSLDGFERENARYTRPYQEHGLCVVDSSHQPVGHCHPAGCSL